MLHFPKPKPHFLKWVVLADKANWQLLMPRDVLLQDWIYRQLCETTTPLHPQLLPLIDVYINSILTPASKSNPEATNQPVTEQEILNVFQGLSGVMDLFGSSMYFM